MPRWDILMLGYTGLNYFWHFVTFVLLHSVPAALWARREEGVGWLQSHRSLCP